MKIQWKPFVWKLGGHPSINYARVFNEDSTLLQRIHMMPRKIPISLHDAYNAYSLETVGRWQSQDPDYPLARLLQDLERDWLKWVSESGFHVCLTGDEYQLEEELAVFS